MRLATYTVDGRTTFGVATDEGIVEAAQLDVGFSSVLEVLEAGALRQIEAAANGRAPARSPGDVTLLPPVLRPEKILCVGVNYSNRNAEYQDGSEPPRYPSLFFRTPGSLVGHEQPIMRPRVSPQFDYEGEIALVIGSSGRHVSAANALGLIAGCTVANDGSVRDWLRHGKFNVTQGKNFDRSGSLGPYLVTADELDLTSPFRLSTRVNGELRQDDTTASLIFSFADLIAYVTTFTTLRAGDVILTGTPPGAGARFDPPRWLAPGDVVEVEVSRLGTIRNPVIDEA